MFPPLPAMEAQGGEDDAHDDGDRPGAWLVLRNVPRPPELDNLPGSRDLAAEADAELDGVPASAAAAEREPPEAQSFEPVPLKPPRGGEAYGINARRLGFCELRKRQGARIAEARAVNRQLAATRAGHAGLCRKDVRKKLRNRALFNRPRCTAMTRSTGERCRRDALNKTDRCGEHHGAFRNPACPAAIRAARRGEFRDFYQAADPRDAHGRTTASARIRRRHRRELARLYARRPDVWELVRATFDASWVEKPEPGSQLPLDGREAINLDLALAARWMLDTGDDVPWIAEIINWDGKLPAGFDAEAFTAERNAQLREHRRKVLLAKRRREARMRRVRGQD